jgi:hypothetical protein
MFFDHATGYMLRFERLTKHKYEKLKTRPSIYVVNED